MDDVLFIDWPCWSSDGLFLIFLINDKGISSVGQCYVQAGSPMECELGSLSVANRFAIVFTSLVDLVGMLKMKFTWKTALDWKVHAIRACFEAVQVETSSTLAAGNQDWREVHKLGGQALRAGGEWWQGCGRQVQVQWHNIQRQTRLGNTTDQAPEVWTA